MPMAWHEGASDQRADPSHRRGRGPPRSPLGDSLHARGGLHRVRSDRLRCGLGHPLRCLARTGDLVPSAGRLLAGQGSAGEPGGIAAVNNRAGPSSGDDPPMFGASMAQSHRVGRQLPERWARCRRRSASMRDGGGPSLRWGLVPSDCPTPGAWRRVLRPSHASDPEGSLHPAFLETVPSPTC